MYAGKKGEPYAQLTMLGLVLNGRKEGEATSAAKRDVVNSYLAGVSPLSEPPSYTSQGPQESDATTMSCNSFTRSLLSGMSVSNDLVSIVFSILICCLLLSLVLMNVNSPTESSRCSPIPVFSTGNSTSLNLIFVGGRSGFYPAVEQLPSGCEYIDLYNG